MALAEWFDHPAVQGGIAPLVVGSLVALLLIRTRFAWVSIAAGYLTSLILSGDLGFVPLTAARKVIVVGLCAAIFGIAADALRARYRALPVLLSAAAGIVTLWVFLSVFRQREGLALFGTAIGIVLFVGAMTAAVLRLRDDGIRAGATGLGAGLGVGIAGVLSASIGYLLGGVAVAASAGAMLLIQILGRVNLPAGYTGTLAIGVLIGCFAAATFLLASLPWYALPLLLAIPLAASLPLPARSTFARAALASAYALVAALLPVLAAWYAARGSFT